MASVKEHFSKGIGYIKYEISKLSEQKAELQEFIGYHKGLDTYIARVRVSRATADIERINSDMYDLKQELLFYKDYFRYTQAELDAIPQATAESIKKDWVQIEKEKNDDKWTQADHDALMQRVREYDIAHGRLVV